MRAKVPFNSVGVYRNLFNVDIRKTRAVCRAYKQTKSKMVNLKAVNRYNQVRTLPPPVCLWHQLKCQNFCITSQYCPYSC